MLKVSLRLCRICQEHDSCHINNLIGCNRMKTYFGKQNVIVYLFQLWACGRASYSTVTDFAKFLGISTFKPLRTAT